MITSQQRSTVPTVAVYGRFDAHEAPAVRAALQQAIRAARSGAVRSAAVRSAAVRVDLTMTGFFVPAPSSSSSTPRRRDAPMVSTCGSSVHPRRCATS